MSLEIGVFNGPPSAGGTNGTAVDDDNPITADPLESGQNGTSDPILLATRVLTPAFEHVGAFDVELLGAGADRWRLAPDVAGAPGTWEAYGDTLTLSDITATNTLFWAQQRVTSDEVVATDTEYTDCILRVPQDITAAADPGRSWDLPFNLEGYQDVIAAAASKLHWWKLDETSGTNADDAVGTSDGTHTNGPTVNQTPGSGGVSVGKCVDYERDDSEYTTMGDVADVDTATVYTIEMLVKFESLPAASSLFSFIAKHNATNGWFFTLFNQAGTYKFFCNANSTAEAAANIAWLTPPTTGVWYHIAFVVDTVTSNTLEVFVDGVSQGSATQNDVIGNTSHPLVIGAYGVGGTPQHYFDGQIDEVVFYNAKLSAATLLAHSQAR